jgi:hypothetical protein
MKINNLHETTDSMTHSDTDINEDLCPKCGGTRKVQGPFGGPEVFTCLCCNTSIVLKKKIKKNDSNIRQ